MLDVDPDTEVGTVGVLARLARQHGCALRWFDATERELVVIGRGIPSIVPLVIFVDLVAGWEDSPEGLDVLRKMMHRLCHQAHSSL